MMQHYDWLRQSLWKSGPALIVVGLAIIVAAQLWMTLPVVTAIAMIGRGAILTLQARPRTGRQDSLIALNLAVYSTLVGLAIVAQSNAVQRLDADQVSLAMLLDHALALVIVAGLVCRVYGQLSQPIAE